MLQIAGLFQKDSPALAGCQSSWQGAKCRKGTCSVLARHTSMRLFDALSPIFDHFRRLFGPKDHQKDHQVMGNSWPLPQNNRWTLWQVIDCMALSRHHCNKQCIVRGVIQESVKTVANNSPNINYCTVLSIISKMIVIVSQISMYFKFPFRGKGGGVGQSSSTISFFFVHWSLRVL